MPSYCAVFGCSNGGRKAVGNKNISYFRFPSDQNLAKQWIVACRRADNFNARTARICSTHFNEGSYEKPLKYHLLNYSPKNRRKLKKTAVPTENLPVMRGTAGKSLERKKRIEKRTNRNFVVELLKSAETSNEMCSNNAGKQTLDEMLAKERLAVESLLQLSMQESQSPVLGENGVGTENSIQISEQESGYLGLAEERFKYEAQIASLQHQIKKIESERDYWKNLCTALTSEKNHLAKELSAFDGQVQQRLEVLLHPLFTSGQIKHLLDPTKKNIHWSTKDIAYAVQLRSVSPKAYFYLRSKLNFPLPAFSTLRRWATTLNLEPGVIYDVIALMKEKGMQLNEIERLTVLSFDEMYISNRVCIDKSSEQIYGPCKTCQVVMARGLVGQWRQPVYYQFDQKMKKDIILNIVSTLFTNGYIVVAMTCDMGGGNTALWSEMNIGTTGERRNFFIHPCDNSLHVYAFADVPHLLKLARNNLFGHGFIVNEQLVDKSCFEELLRINTSDLKIAHKITRYHLDVHGSKKQKVSLAAQIFSNTLSKAIQWCGENKLIQNSTWKETSNILRAFNDWFDVFNSKNKFGSHAGVNAFGINLEKQMAVVKDMTEMIASIRVGKHKSMLPFQKGILISNNSLIDLFNDLKNKYDIHYILTNRLNQDILENLFSYVRSMGATNDNPSPIDVKYRLRWYILGKHSETIVNMKRKTDDMSEKSCTDSTLSITNVSQPPEESDGICLTQSMLNTLIEPQPPVPTDEIEEISSIPFIESESNIPEIDTDDVSISEENWALLRSFELTTASDMVQNEGLKYVAGYVAHRFRNKITLGIETQFLSCNNSPDWIQCVSRGKLMYPSDELLVAAKIMNCCFEDFHGKFYSRCTNVFKKVAEITISNLPPNCTIPYEVILCLVRVRTYIRIRELNKKISIENNRRQLAKTMTKFTNVQGEF